MAVFKELSPNSIKSAKTYMSQMIEILQQDISGSSTRKKYQHFVTASGMAPGVTSSLFQTVYDQDFTLQTTNAQFDITFGLYHTGSTVNNTLTSVDSSGKMLFPSQSLMMREKIDVYKQMAQMLLGDPKAVFTAPFNSSNPADMIDTALFVSFKRLFARDKIKRETFATKIYKYANEGVINLNTVITGSELTSSFVYTDVGSATTRNTSVGGEVGSLVDASNTNSHVGLLFYDRGIAVLDMGKVFAKNQLMSGAISSVNGYPAFGLVAGQSLLGGTNGGNSSAKFIPDLVVSGSIDNVIDHVCSTRFYTGSVTAMTFQNITNINSTLVHIQADPDEFNYSSNPTFTDNDDRIVVIEPGQEDISQTFTFVSTVGLYDANDNLLAVAKLSRPVEKSPERSLSLRLRIDF